MQRKIELFIKILIGLTFFVPLVVIPSQFIFPFIVPKVLLFRTIVLLMLGGYLLLLASSWKEYRLRITPVSVAVGLFFVSFLLSTFIGVDWYSSFWDNHERMLGLFTILHYVLYYIILTTLVRDWGEWKWFLRVFLFAGSIVMVIGMWQKFQNPEFLLNKGNVRVSATLGNPIYYSAYGMFIAFMSYLLAIKEKTWGLWRIYAIIGGMLGFIGMFLGGTRGVLVAFAAGIGVLLLSYAILLKDKPKLRKTFGIIMLVGVLVLGVLFAFRKTESVKQIPALGRLLNTQLSGGTANTRIMAWGIAVDAWQENPVFGWGPNNYYYAFNKYYRPEFLDHGYGETWFDNAHNIIMNTLAVQGALGILVYFGLFGTVIVVLWKKSGDGVLDVHIVSIGTAFLVAHFVGNIFVFENPTSYLYFMFFLALVNSLSTKKHEEKFEKGSHRISLGSSIVTPLFIALLIFATNVQPAQANSASLDAIRQIYSNGDPIGAHDMTISVSSPHSDDIRNDYARAAIQLISKYASAGNVDLSRQVFDLAYRGLERNKEIHPGDIRVHIQQAQLLQLATQIQKDTSYLFDAESVLEEARTYSPKRQQLSYMLSAVKLQIGKPQEAIALLEETISNNSSVAEGWWRLAAVYHQLGMTDKAVEIINSSKDDGVVFGDSELQVIQGIMSAAGLNYIVE